MIILFLLAINSSYFLKLTPGVMSQGLGGVEVMIDEGLSAFHNPVISQDIKVNFTLSRWLNACNLFTAGISYKDNLIGINYLNYGRIQAYNNYGVATHDFTPYDIILIYARRIGSFGFFVKTFGEKIDSVSLYGLCGGISSHLDFGKIAIGAKLDNLGKEFVQNTTIPFTTALGLRFTLPLNTDLFIESKAPDLEINFGLMYEYQNARLLFGAKLLTPENLVEQEKLGLRFSDAHLTTGIIVTVERYEIGYSFVYTEFSGAHQFSIALTP